MTFHDGCSHSNVYYYSTTLSLPLVIAVGSTHLCYGVLDLSIYDWVDHYSTHQHSHTQRTQREEGTGAKDGVRATAAFPLLPAPYK